jgi:putative membrane protein
MFWYGDGGYGGGGGVVVMVFWGLVIAGLVVVFRQPERRDRVAGGMVPAHRTAQQLLAERFARGDIDEAEFTGRLAALHGQKQL